MSSKDARLMSVKQISLYLGIKVSRLRKAVRMREVPFIRIGRLIFFDKVRIEKWLMVNQNRKEKKS